VEQEATADRTAAEWIHEFQCKNRGHTSFSKAIEEVLPAEQLESRDAPGEYFRVTADHLEGSI
jgi:hypothetical protein